MTEDNAIGSWKICAHNFLEQISVNFMSVVEAKIINKNIKKQSITPMNWTETSQSGLQSKVPIGKETQSPTL